MKVLISAFEPFGNSIHNSSLDTLLSLPKEIEGCVVNTTTLPVVYDLCGQVLCSAIDAIHPDFVLSLGQAEGRGQITPEYVALNVKHSQNEDNIGQVFLSSPIDARGPDAHFSTLFPNQSVDYLSSKSIPASLSFSAGTYVCNNLMYRSLAFCKPLGIRAGFIHLPLSYEIAAAEYKAGKVMTLPQSILTEAIIKTVGYIADNLN